MKRYSRRRVEVHVSILVGLGGATHNGFEECGV